MLNLMTLAAIATMFSLPEDLVGLEPSPVEPKRLPATSSATGPASPTLVPEPVVPTPFDPQAAFAEFQQACVLGRVQWYADGSFSVYSPKASVLFPRYRTVGAFLTRNA